MNIIILYPTPFLPSKDSFYYFYKQLTDWLTAKGMPSTLYFAYLNNKGKEEEIEGIQLPDTEKFGTMRNVDALTSYIVKKEIHVLFNFYNSFQSVCFLFRPLKQNIPTLKIINLIHNCPNHVLQLKHYQLVRDNSTFEIKTIKNRIISAVPFLYLWLLRIKIRRDTVKECILHDVTIVLSPSYIPEYLSLTRGKFADKVFAIPNPLAPKDFYPTVLPPEKKNKEIIFVGGFRKEKAIPILLRIWQKVQHRIPEWKLTIIGDGESMPNYLKLSETLQLQRIDFKGFQNSRPFINQASILCLTSVIEGFPTVFTEAMIMGVVPIGFDTFSAIYDMIDNWENGVIIPAFNEELYVEAIVKLASNDILRTKMGEAAQKKVKQYDINIIAPMWIPLLK